MLSSLESRRPPVEAVKAITVPCNETILEATIQMVLHLAQFFNFGTIHKQRRQFLRIFDTPFCYVVSFLVLSVSNLDPSLKRGHSCSQKYKKLSPEGSKVVSMYVSEFLVGL